MGSRYSREELEKIKSLVGDGLTNREIAVQLGRPEAGIRNLRYRLNLKMKKREDIRSLLSHKEGLEARIAELNQMIIELSNEVRSLEEKKKCLDIALREEERSLKRKIARAQNIRRK